VIVVGLSSSFPWQAPVVSVKFLSAVRAAICWKNVNAVPDQWMITLTRGDDVAHFYTLDGRTSKQKLPVQLKPRTKYIVTVSPLFESSFYPPSHWMLDGSTTTFTTPTAGYPLVHSVIPSEIGMKVAPPPNKKQVAANSVCHQSLQISGLKLSLPFPVPLYKHCFCPSFFSSHSLFSLSFFLCSPIPLPKLALTVPCLGPHVIFSWGPHTL